MERKIKMKKQKRSNNFHGKLKKERNSNVSKRNYDLQKRESYRKSQKKR